MQNVKHSSPVDKDANMYYNVKQCLLDSFKFNVGLRQGYLKGVLSRSIRKAAAGPVRRSANLCSFWLLTSYNAQPDLPSCDSKIKSDLC